MKIFALGDLCEHTGELVRNAENDQARLLAIRVLHAALGRHGLQHA